MTVPHPNAGFLWRRNLQNLDTSATIISDDVTWDFFNPILPAVQRGDGGVDGLRPFFGAMARETDGSIALQPVSVKPFRNEPRAVPVRHSMGLEGASPEIDAVVVWHRVDGRIAEAWDMRRSLPSRPTVRNRGQDTSPLTRGPNHRERHHGMFLGQGASVRLFDRVITRLCRRGSETGHTARPKGRYYNGRCGT